MSFSQNRDVTHFSAENSRVWSLKCGEFGFEDWEYVNRVRATGQRPPSQPTAWMLLDPVDTSVYPPPAGSHTDSTLFHTPSDRDPPGTAMRFSFRTTNWCSPSRESSGM